MHIILADLSSELLFYEVPFAPSSKTPLQVVAFFVLAAPSVATNKPTARHQSIKALVETSTA